MRDPAYRFDLERRDFFKLLGGGVVLLLALDHQPRRRNPDAAGAVKDCRRPSARGCISARDGTVTVFTGKTEVGQNIRTSLAQAVAEELRTPVASITLVMADTA